MSRIRLRRGRSEGEHGIALRHEVGHGVVLSLEELQTQLDWFRTYYNTVRPHRALGRRTPAEAFAARPKDLPRRPVQDLPAHVRIRHDRIDSSGVVTLRYNSHLHHVGLGRAHAGRRVLLLVADLDVRVLTEDGELLRQLTLDPTRDYKRRPGGGKDVPRHV